MGRNKPEGYGISIYASVSSRKLDLCRPNMMNAFFRGKVMYALYIDDSILGAPTRHELDVAIAAIKDAKLQITLEGDLADFLGVKIERKSPNEIIFT